MTTIVTGFGKFRYNRLPIGMHASGYIFQYKVDGILGDIKGVKTYIDDILVLSKDCFKKHIEQLRIIFGRLRALGLKVNSTKFNFGLKDIPFLFYIITREGIKPEPNRLQVIRDLGRPSATTEARNLIGMVKYYRYICTRQSHVLAPTTEAAIGLKVREIFLNDAIESYFKELNRVVSDETLLSDPYWKLPFTVHTNAPDKQLFDVISQNNKPISFLSRRLSKPQRSYTTNKRELLAIVERLKKFNGIRFGYKINVFSDY